MDEKSISTRRRFFSSAGAVLAAPLAAGTVRADEAGRSERELRLARLEDREAIRELNRAFVRHSNARSIAGSASPSMSTAVDRVEVAALFAESADLPVEKGLTRLAMQADRESEVIEISPDRTSARATLRCNVELEAPIGPDCTLVEMARLQGDGTLGRVEARALELEYVNCGNVWKIARSSYRSLP
jgi:hypothetical protein